MSPQRARIWSTVLVLIVGVFGAQVARAHSGLAAASPAPGAVVGGEIEQIRIFYADIITDFDGSVTAPSGEVLEATAEMSSDISAVIALAQPLTENGQYEVRHTITSVDDDVVDAAYLFTYDDAAAPPQLVFVESDDDGGVSTVVWIVLGVGLVVIAVLAWRLIAAIRARSRPDDGPD